MVLKQRRYVYSPLQWYPGINEGWNFWVWFQGVDTVKYLAVSNRTLSQLAAHISDVDMHTVLSNQKYIKLKKCTLQLRESPPSDSLIYSLD